MTSTLTSTEQCLSCTAKSTQPSSWVCQSKPPRRNSKSQRSPSPQQIPESQQGAVWSQVLILRTNFIQFHVKNVTLLSALLIWMKCITFLMCFQVSRKWGRLWDHQSVCGLWMGWDGGGGGGYLYKNILCPSFWKINKVLTLIALFILCGQNIFQTCSQMPMTLSVFGISPVNLAFINYAQHRIFCPHQYMLVHKVQTFTLLILACILNLFSILNLFTHSLTLHLQSTGWEIICERKGIVALLHLKFRCSS